MTSEPVTWLGDTEGYGELDWAIGFESPEWGAWVRPDLDSPYTFVIRQSTSGNMLLCGGRVGLRLGVEQDDPSAAMFNGTAQHFCIDRFIDDYLSGTALDWVSDVEEIESFLEGVALEHDGFVLRSKFKDKAHMRQWSTEVMFLLSSWIEDWFIGGNNIPMIEQAVLREEILYRPLGKVGVYEIWLRGSPDLVTPDVLVDWKTAGRGWRKGKAAAQAQDDLYAGLVEYNMGLQLNNGLFVVGNVATRKWEEHPTRMTRASIDAALFRTWTHARDLVLGTWSYTPSGPFGLRDWPCRPKWCDAWDRCPARFLGDEYDILSQENRGIW